MQQTSFKVGDRVRVIRIPPHIDDPQYLVQEVQRAFAVALGNTYTVEDVDWGGWVWLYLGEESGAIGVQPDCVELSVDTTENRSSLLPTTPAGILGIGPSQ